MAIKIVHINKKNLELEAAYKEMAVEIGEKESRLMMKQYLKRKAKREAKTAGLPANKLTIDSAEIKNADHSIY